MPRGKSGQHLENTREIRGAVGGEASRCAEFSDAVKRDALSGDCAAGLGAGTALANMEILIGCGPIPSLFPHGGARNSVSRTSEALTLADAEKLLAATKRAIARGRPFNRFLTVHWEAMGLTDWEAMAATTAFLKYLREWLRCETAYVWTRENGDGKGSYLHILTYFPERRNWSSWIGRRPMPNFTRVRRPKPRRFVWRRLTAAGRGCCGPLAKPARQAASACGCCSAKARPGT